MNAGDKDWLAHECRWDQSASIGQASRAQHPLPACHKLNVLVIHS